MRTCGELRERKGCRRERGKNQREGKRGHSKGAGGEAPVLDAYVESLLPAQAREQRPALGEGAMAAGSSAPTVNLDIIIDVSVPARKKTGCCEQSGLPCPHRLPTLRQDPAPGATSVPSLLTCLRALLTPCSPVRLLTASRSPHREGILQCEVCSALDPPVLHMDSGPVLRCREPQIRLRRGPALARRAGPPAAPERGLGRSHVRYHSLGRAHSTPGSCSQHHNLS